MYTKKTLIGLLLLAVLLLEVGAVSAAPAREGTAIEGTVQSITQSTDASGNVIFIVVVDASGAAQTVRLAASDAVSLGLVTDNGNGTYTINDVVGTSISIPGTMPLANPCDETESGIVASALSAFFCGGSSTVLNTSIGALHQQGFGFGEIAQACFMAQALGTTCDGILAAKKSHDFSMLGLSTEVKNWGQLRKYALTQEVKSLTNLGAIMSGRATPPAVGPTPAPTPVSPSIPPAGDNGNGQGQGHGSGGKGNGHGNGHGKKP